MERYFCYGGAEVEVVVDCLRLLKTPPGHKVCAPGMIDIYRPGERDSKCGLVLPVTAFVAETGVLVSSKLVDPSRKLVALNLMNIGKDTTLVHQSVPL